MAGVSRASEMSETGGKIRHETFRDLGLRFFLRPHAEILRRPLAVDAAWRGADLRSSEAWTHRLTRDQIAELDAALAHVRRSGLALAEVGRAEFPLPELGPVVAAWAREIDRGRGFVLVRGFPVDDYDEADAATIYWGIGQHMGIPGEQNPAGELLGHVQDTGAALVNPSVRAYQTHHRIDFHADLSDVVGLLCLREARSGGASRIVSSVAVYNEVVARRPDLIDVLYEPFCIDRRDEQDEGELPYLAIPLCRYAAGRLSTFYHTDYIHSALRHPEVPRFSQRQCELVELYEAIACSPEFYLDMDFQPGDMQFLSNHVLLHARGAYDDYDEPERKRHLLRLWLSLRDEETVDA